MVRAVPPVLVNVTVCAALAVPTTKLPKLKVEALTDADAGVTAVPLTETVCGELGALSLRTREAVAVPGEVGSRVTWRSHTAPG